MERTKYTEQCKAFMREHLNQPLRCEMYSYEVKPYAFAVLVYDGDRQFIVNAKTGQLVETEFKDWPPTETQVANALRKLRAERK